MLLSLPLLLLILLLLLGSHPDAITTTIAAMSISYNANDKDVAIYALNAIIYLCRYDGDNRDTHSNSNVSKLEPVCLQVTITTTNTTNTISTNTINRLSGF